MQPYTHAVEMWASTLGHDNPCVSQMEPSIIYDLRVKHSRYVKTLSQNKLN